MNKGNINIIVYLIIISVIVIIFSFVACENNSSSEITATTAVTNEQGATHYYKAITDKNKKFITNKSGETITTEISIKNTSKSETTISIYDHNPCIHKQQA